MSAASGGECGDVGRVCQPRSNACVSRSIRARSSGERGTATPASSPRTAEAGAPFTAYAHAPARCRQVCDAGHALGCGGSTSPTERMFYLAGGSDLDANPAIDLEAARASCHEVKPSGGFVGRPSHRHDLDEWDQYAYDTAEKAVNGKRSREWTAVAPTEVEVVREMARCLREVADGCWPR